MWFKYRLKYDTYEAIFANRHVANLSLEKQGMILPPETQNLTTDKP